MTRRLPSEELRTLAADGAGRWQSEAVNRIFSTAPAWQREAALAAVYRIRPDLGGAVDDAAHQVHMFMWPRDAAYFVRVCQLFRLFDIGTEWGEG